ncbi:tetratricopeptide repeat-containing diguanylate cyclase [Shewanella sp. AS16]|uniref:tetratricopeptide repeat-containing diguanylate cyclase n=1 Tax=Shewanella sp. AS16 TaxID=2907625 RepID=UPI003FA354F8
MVLYSGHLIAAMQEYDQTLDEIGVILHSDVSTSVTRLNELELSFDKLSPAQQGRFLTFKGIAFIYNAHYREALINFNQAELLVKDTYLLASLYSYKATAYIATRDFERALAMMAKSLALIVRIEDVDIKRSAYLRLASLYNGMEASDAVALYATKAIELADADDVKDICTAKLYLAVSALELRSLDSAFSDFENTLSYCKQNGLSLIANMALKGLGWVKLREGDFPLSRNFLLKALTGYETFNFQLEISHVHALLAQNYLATGEDAEAKLHAERVITQPEDPSSIEHKQLAYRVLSELAARQGAFEQAYEYSLQDQHYSKLLFDEKKMKALAYQSSKFNVDEKEREINLLNRERELYMAMQRVKERERTNMLMLVTILIGGVIFLAILFIAGMMQKRKYKRMASLDSLTGILNRGAGQELAENLFVQTLAKGGSFSVILFDLDHFKRINDSFGHGTGDWALKKVVETLKSRIRSCDVFSRVGGEEFGIFLPSASEAQALEVAQLCREKIAAINTQHSGHEFSLTASFGVSSMGDSDLSLDPLLHRADLALYAAKSQGRNLVVAYSAALGPDKGSNAGQSKLSLSPS